MMVVVVSGRWCCHCGESRGSFWGQIKPTRGTNRSDQQKQHLGSSGSDSGNSAPPHHHEVPLTAPSSLPHLIISPCRRYTGFLYGPLRAPIAQRDKVAEGTDTKPEEGEAACQAR
ncbi:hypothetical protein CMUS01_04836 [Colletotrichum musicola]|uniref:Uncharacterized protein n=1 Tax=Colletotrichum musicola TaxID=2175873 RepID=A0A8H6KVA5_9PEZI|nr:hypothetical protein CMUS01_04836 [Colletotrichum musicola]